MANLRELQENLQAYVLQKDLTIENDIVKPANMEVERRLHIYRNAYYMRLLEILESDFVVLQKILGKKPFASMVRDYLNAYPSHHFSVRPLGRHLAKFLKNTPGCDPCYAELAEFEWTLNKALFTKDEDRLTMAALSAIAPEQWPQMLLTLHPSVQTLRFVYNTSERWQAVNNDQEDMASMLLEHPLHHLIWQHNFEAFFCGITPEQNHLIRAIAQGEPFGVLCETMLEHFTEEEVVSWVANTLHHWIDEGIFSSNIAFASMESE